MSQQLGGGSGVADGTGAALVIFGPGNAWQRWSVERIAVAGNSTLVPVVRVYRNAQQAGAQIDSSLKGQDNASEYPNPIDLGPSEQLLVAWSGCTPGATMTATAYGETAR